MDRAEMEARLSAALAEAQREVGAARSLAELDAAERRHLGKGSVVLACREAIKDLELHERPEAGRRVKEFRETVEAALAARREELAAVDTADRAVRERVDVTLPGRDQRRGHLHLITQVWRELEDVFVGMGYTVAEGPEVETDWYNFEALNIPKAHPARSMWDTLYVRLGMPEEVLLRTHTSPVQVRVMESRQPPIYVVAPGRCYRRDTLDATHSPMFHQIEGLVVDRSITFGDLAGTIEAFTEAYFGVGAHSRLRPSFFPFTEPSAEFEVVCYVCHGEGCPVCGGGGWIELGGCGMVHPKVFEAVGYDPEAWTGFAFGFGLERMALNRFGIDHIKQFFENDVRFLRQF